MLLFSFAKTANPFLFFKGFERSLRETFFKKFPSSSASFTISLIKIRNGAEEGIDIIPFCEGRDIAAGGDDEIRMDGTLLH